MPDSSRPKGRGQRIALATRVLLVLIVLSAGFAVAAYWYMVRAEGQWQGEPLEAQGLYDLGDIRQELESDVAYLQELGPRNADDSTAYDRLRQAEAWTRARWESQGYTVRLHDVSVRGQQFYNLEIEFPGVRTPSEIIIISAQYDTEPDSPGANNNGSGMAVLFQLSKLLKGHAPDRTLRLVAFVNEQAPFAGTEMMGSHFYARGSFDSREDIKVMMSMDAIGIYRDAPGSQNLPFPFSLFYPDRGNFLAFIGNLPSRSAVKEVTAAFRKGSAFPIAGGVAPEWVKGVTWSDHRSFFAFGYKGVQITDTGGFRATSHGTPDDTMEKMDFEALSRIAIGMYSVAVELSSTRQ